jgi:hypothetical protein
MAETIAFEIKEHIGRIGPISDKGWSRQINKISWNGGPVKWDIREFSSDMQRMSRGITLTDAEMKRIIDLVKDRF